MKTYKDDAYVIRVRPFVDTEKIAVLLTRNHGLIEAIVKGHGKPLSRTTSAIDILNKVKVMLYKGKSLDLITDVKLTDNYQELKTDTAIIADIFLIAEIAEKFSVHNGEEIHYLLLEQVLEALRANKSQSLIIMAWFELHIMAESGFEPLLDTCIATGETHLPNEERFASISDFIPGYSKAENHHSVVASDRCLKIQKFLLANSIADAQQLTVQEQEISNIRVIHQIWLELVLENKLKSSTFYIK